MCDVCGVRVREREREIKREREREREGERGETKQRAFVYLERKYFRSHYTHAILIIVVHA